MPLLVHFGAGNIGRSLCGQLFSAAGWEVVFVDAVPAVVGALNQERSYRVIVKDDLAPGEPAEIRVARVRGLLASDAEAVAGAVAGADLVSTAVGAAIVPRILPAIARGLERRGSPLNIVFCENLHGCAEIAREELRRLLPPGFDLDARVGLVATSIGKMVPILPEEVRRRDPLEVWAEAYNLIIADRDAFVGEPPPVEGLVLKRNFAAYVDRKLYIHNYGHAVAAYHGHLAGRTFLWECMADKAIRATAEAAMTETGDALIRKYPTEFDSGNQREHIGDLLRRFGNRALGDTVFRVGRDLPRKLAPGDRCVGALRLVQETGRDPVRACRAIAAALRFRAVDESGAPFAPDAAIVDRVAREGPEGVLREICGFRDPADTPVIGAIRAEIGR